MGQLGCALSTLELQSALKIEQALVKCLVIVIKSIIQRCLKSTDIFVLVFEQKLLQPACDQQAFQLGSPKHQSSNGNNIVHVHLASKFIEFFMHTLLKHLVLGGVLGESKVL